MAVLDFNGTTIRMQNVRYMEKVQNKHNPNEKGINFVFWSGASTVAWYGSGYNSSLYRNHDYKNALKYLN